MNRRIARGEKSSAWSGNALAVSKKKKTKVNQRMIAVVEKKGNPPPVTVYFFE